MIKRKISLFLAVFMLISMLAGCNVNEIGYMNLSAEMNKLTQIEIKNSTQIEIPKEITGKDVNSKLDIDIQGEANIDDFNKAYLNLNIKFELDGKGNTSPIKFMMIDNKFYVSKNILSEMLKFRDDLNLELDETEVLIAEKLVEELKDVEYIVLPNQYGISGMEELKNSNISVTYKDNKAIIESAKKYLTNAFKGFESKFIKKTGNGYIMELNAKDVWSFVSRLVKYISENKELIFDETIKYLETVYANMEIKEGAEAVDTKSAIEEFKALKEDFYKGIDEIYKSIETMETEDKEELDKIINMFGQSYLKNEIYKEGNTYGQKIDAKIIVEGILSGSIKSKTTISPKAVKNALAPNKAITTEEIDELNKKLENKYNPVKIIEISWYRDYPEDGADIDIYRANGNADYTNQPYVMKDGRIYLPFEDIFEVLVEKNQWYWSAENNRAYFLLSDGQEFYMEGLTINGEAMIRVKDFEQLGFTVEYIQGEDFSLARIIKNK